MKFIICAVLGHKMRDLDLYGFQARHCIRCTEIEPYKGVPKRTTAYLEHQKFMKKPKFKAPASMFFEL